MRGLPRGRADESTALNGRVKCASRRPTGRSEPPLPPARCAVANGLCGGSQGGHVRVRPGRPWLHLLESELDDTDQNENDDDDHDNAHDSNAAVSRVHAGPPLRNPGSSALFLSGSLIPDHVPERFNRAIDATNALQPGARNQHEGEQH